MASTSQQQKGRDGVLSTLDVFIRALDIAKGACAIPPAQVAFGCASVLLAMIRDTMTNDQDYVELGRTCAGVCGALYRRLNGRRSDELSKSLLDAIGDLTATVTDIQGNVAKRGKRNAASRFLHAMGDKEKVAGWKQDLVKVLQVFNTELVIDIHMTVADTHTIVEDIHRNVLAGQQATLGKNQSTQASISPGEFPPPAPRACFGRDELIEKVIALAENLKPIALIGAGGIGKTSVALTVLHHNRIEERFGENRRFIRCDQFPASRTHFLARLSKVIGAGVENPEDLTPLRPFLSSREMFIVLDNAESVLDPKGTSAEEIYSVVDELSQFKKVCLCITSRLMMVPPHCKRPEVATLSMGAAGDVFYSIYNDRGRSQVINSLLERLDFHALSITLLATTASYNGWDYDRLAKEWDTQRVQVLQTDYNKSLAATIELSLTSPTFSSLGPGARDLLGVVAFFPQGISEKNLNWLFPTISNRNNIFDKFCVLSLTYRSNGFVTMLAPIRDYICPQDSQSSPLLCVTRDRYFTRLSVEVNPGKPGFEETRWIALEDVNVEHLLDVFTSTDNNAGGIWDVCDRFMEHLYWHKPRKTILGSKIEALADDHRSKPKSLSKLSRVLGDIGNYTEQKRLLSLALELYRRSGDDRQVAQTLRFLSDANRLLELFEEGTLQAKEALGIYKQIDDVRGQMRCLDDLAWLFFCDEKLDAAEEAASRVINLTIGNDDEFLACKLHRVLGKIYQSKGEKIKAIQNFETALGIVPSSNLHDLLFWIHQDLAELFCHEAEYDDANAHLEQAKPHAVDDPYNLGCAAYLQSRVWYQQQRLEEARSEASHAFEIFEKLGAVKEVETCRDFLQIIEEV